MPVTATWDVTLQCDTQAEYDEQEVKVDNYSPQEWEADMSDLVKTPANKKITYKLSKTG